MKHVGCSPCPYAYAQCTAPPVPQNLCLTADLTIPTADSMTFTADCATGRAATKKADTSQLTADITTTTADQNL